MNDDIAQRNLVLAQQLDEMIVAVYGEQRPFILVLPGLPEEDHGALAANIEAPHIRMALQDALSQCGNEGTFHPRGSKGTLS